MFLSQQGACSYLLGTILFKKKKKKDGVVTPQTLDIKKSLQDINAKYRHNNHNIENTVKIIETKRNPSKSIAIVFF